MRYEYWSVQNSCLTPVLIAAHAVLMSELMQNRDMQECPIIWKWTLLQYDQGAFFWRIMQGGDLQAKMKAQSCGKVSESTGTCM